MNIEWRQVEYRGILLPYEVSEFGSVRRIAGKDCAGRNRPCREVKAHPVSSGYLQVILKADRKTYSPLVHTLVAIAFLPAPPSKYGRGDIGVNHKDCVKTNNHHSNLEWATGQQNSDHAVANGLIARGEEASNVVLTENQVIEIRNRRAAGEGRNVLAREFSVCNYAVYAICVRKTWKHI